MSAVHDLGGKAGFGPVDVDEPEEPFHADWEGRMWAISRLTRGPGWTIDWWRHVRETIPAETYLSRPYFDSWCQTSTAAFIDSGVFTLSEMLVAKADTAQVPAMTRAEALARNRALARNFEMPAQDAPRFAVGDQVRTVASLPDGHTRLPAYARDKTGVVIAHRGAHAFADASARGTERGEHLYTVEFTAQVLWGTEASAIDTVALDLWEPYFV